MEKDNLERRLRHWPHNNQYHCEHEIQYHISLHHEHEKRQTKLEEEWSKGNDVSTENLRQALRRYRAFFHRLLSI